MNTLNKVLNAVVVGSLAAVLFFAIPEILPSIDPKFVKPEIGLVLGLGAFLLAVAVREMFSIHDNLH